MSTEDSTLSIAILDIETLSLSPFAAVYEIGLLTARVTPHYQEIEPQDTVFKLWRPPLLPQLLRGAVADADTIEFLNNKVFSGQAVNALVQYQQDTTPVTDCLDELQAALRDRDEVWIRKPSFDVGILTNMFHRAGVTDTKTLAGWIPHRALYDVRTLQSKNDIPMPDRSDFLAHTAEGDCRREFEILKRYGRKLVEVTTFSTDDTP